MIGRCRLCRCTGPRGGLIPGFRELLLDALEQIHVARLVIPGRRLRGGHARPGSRPDFLAHRMPDWTVIPQRGVRPTVELHQPAELLDVTGRIFLRMVLAW